MYFIEVKIVILSFSESSGLMFVCKTAGVGELWLVWSCRSNSWKFLPKIKYISHQIRKLVIRTRSQDIGIAFCVFVGLSILY